MCFLMGRPALFRLAVQLFCLEAIFDFPGGLVHACDSYLAIGRAANARHIELERS
jgi:hypothetical protein